MIPSRFGNKFNNLISAIFLLIGLLVGFAVFGNFKTQQSSSLLIDTSKNMEKDMKDAAVAKVPTAIKSKLINLKWRPCGDLFCASLNVPLIHSSPGSKNKIEISLVKYPARVRDKKSTLLLKATNRAILVNPGFGPFGISGTEFVKRHHKQLSALFLDRVDIIGFDQRGVGKTIPLMVERSISKEVLNSPKGLGILSKDASAEEMHAYDSKIQKLANSCVRNNSKLLPFISTANTARDMEIIRIALNQRKLNYLGINYGGVLGLTYANMFPNRAGRMIFDSSFNPNAYLKNSFELINILT